MLLRFLRALLARTPRVSTMTSYQLAQMARLQPQPRRGR